MDIVHAIRRSLRLMEPSHRRALYGVAGLNVVSAALDAIGILLLVPFLAILGGVAPTGLAAGVTERFLPGDSPEKVALFLAVAAACVFVVKTVISISLLWIQTGILSRAQVSVAKRLLWEFAEAPRLDQKAATTGATMRNAYISVTSAVQHIGASMVGLVTDMSVLLAVLCALAIVDPLLALGAVVYLGVVGSVYAQVVRRPLVARGERLQKAYESMNNALVEFVGGLQEFILRGQVGKRIDGFGDEYLDVNESLRVFTVANGATRYLLETAVLVGITIVIVIATLTGSAATVLVSVGLLLAGGLRALPALSDLIVLTNHVRAYEPSLESLEEEFARLERVGGVPPANRDLSDEELTKLRCDLLRGRSSIGFEFHEVAFCYPGQAANTLTGINLVIKPGESIGVVGASGAGKSTLVDLLLGFLQPTHGTITIDGHNLPDCIDQWRTVIAVVPQEVFILHGTILDNIVMSESPKSGLDGDGLERALRVAQLESVVEGHPLGLNAPVGERGVLLSGGQRQRMGLARAIYRRPAVLILDEATSALDNETEFLISSAIDELRHEVTTFVVAHRLTTLRHCDRIVFLEGGKLAGFGTFGALRSNVPAFARLVELGNLE